MDFNVICRLCGENKKVLTSIFVDSEDQTKNEILDRIFYLSSLEPFRGDGLPENLCATCKKMLETSCNFKKQIISIEDRLKNELFIIKKEPDHLDTDWDRLGEDYSNENEEKNNYDKIYLDSREENCIKNINEDFPKSPIRKNYHRNRVKKSKKCVKKSFKLVEKDSDILNDSLEVIAEVQSDSSLFFNDILMTSALNNQTKNENFCETESKNENIKNSSKSIKKRVCPECGMLLCSGNFSDHMLVKHGGEPRFPCDICGTKLKTKRLVWAHKKAKHQEKDKINCDQCGMIFMSKNNFKKHYNAIHLDIRKHKCELCEKTFKFQKSYQCHVRSHTGERPYICTYCNKGFSGPWALKQHIRLHTNEKPYKCMHCHEAFTQNVTLKLHIKRKHIEPKEIVPN